MKCTELYIKLEWLLLLLLFVAMYLFFGICVHVIFLFSIFDIYFKSPIVKGVSPYTPQHEATADRIVLFIIDGLRAESFVNYTTMPYLR